jgi:hypothetical protein
LKERKIILTKATQEKNSNTFLWNMIKKLTKGRYSPIPILKDCENNDKAKVLSLASHYEDVAKDKIAFVKDLQDDNQVTPIFC